MGDLDIHGGAGGIQADLDDVTAFAIAVDHAADEVARNLETLGRVRLGLTDDLLEAGLLVPDLVVATEAAALAAVTGTALLRTGLDSAASLARSAVEAYREVDAALARAAEEALYAAGFVAGGLLPVAALGLLATPGTSALLAWWLSDPEHRAAALAELDQTLYENPWLLEALTRSAPGLVQGGATALTGGNPLLLALLTDGSWPSSDYHSSLLGLITLGRRFGWFTDAGGFRAGEREGWRTLPGFGPETFLGDVIDQQNEVGGEAAGRTTVQVLKVRQPDGSLSYIVQIPGTQEMTTLAHGGTLLDMDSNVNLMYLNGQTDRAQVQRQVEAAMAAAGIRPGDPVMLTGHSQGGIIAASIAANPERDWNIRSVVTAGSPIARIPIPDGVQVMSLEHDQDAVPRLDGRSNPGTATWTTVQDDSDAGNVGDAHSLDSYTNLAERIDASDDAGLAAWRRANQEFLSDGSVERTRVTIERAP
jgi:hypothetical protein